MIDIWFKAWMVFLALMVTLLVFGITLAISISTGCWWVMFGNLTYLILGPAYLMLWREIIEWLRFDA